MAILRATKLFGGLAFAALFALSGAAAHADPVVRFDQRYGLFEIKYKSFLIATGHFVFWRDNWKWIGPHIRTDKRDTAYTFETRWSGDTFDLAGTVQPTDERTMVWETAFTAPEEVHARVYGGISFKFNTEAFTRNGDPIEAEVLPGETGWRLTLENGQPPIELRFDEAPVTMYFERGRKNELRAYFFNKDPTKNQRRMRMTLTLPPGGKVVPTLTERQAAPDLKTWHRGLFPWNGSPVDLSFLNRRDGPAGSRGFVRAEGDQLVFEDGTPARFWGSNITAYALYTTRGTKRCEEAARISRLGFNLIRLTHHDSHWVRPNIFGDKAPDTLSLSNDSLRRLDWWIHCLKENGIYVWLDLHVGRKFTKADGIDHFEEAAKGGEIADAHGYAYVNQSIQERLKAFNEAYLNRVNSYTGLAYKDDPAVLAVMITNENDLTHHFGNGLLPDKNVPEHNKIYMGLAREFADRWNLSANQTWRSWTPGPSKLFLSDLEHRFNQEMIGHLRGLGVRSAISTTNSWGGMSMSGLFSLTDGDLVDVHSYGGAEPFDANSMYVSNLAHWIAAAQVEGMPLSVTEWDPQPHPVAIRAGVPAYIAAIAGLQGWDAMMQYAYGQNSLHLDNRPKNWQAYNDPAMMALMPAAALLYRDGHVSQARQTYALAFGDRLVNEYLSPRTSVAVRTLAEQSRVTVRLPRPPSLPWLKRTRRDPDAIVVEDPDRSFLPADSAEVTSDTGELTRNWVDGIFRIDTPKTQLAAGWIGGSPQALTDVTIETALPHAAVAVQSLTEQPIAGSNRILLSMGAQSVIDESGYLSEPIPAEIRIRAKPGLVLSALLDNGRKAAVPVDYDGEVYTVRTNPRLKTWWYLLEEAS